MIVLRYSNIKEEKVLIWAESCKTVWSDEQEHVSLSDEGPLLETLEFFEISHGSYEPLNLLP